MDTTGGRTLTVTPIGSGIPRTVEAAAIVATTARPDGGTALALRGGFELHVPESKAAIDRARGVA